MKVKIGEEIRLECQVCGHDEFAGRQAQLNTAFMSYLQLDFLNKTAECFVCCRCGYVHWFFPENAEWQIHRKIPQRQKADEWTPPL